MPKAKKRKTSSTARKSVSRKPIAVQKKVVKKDKSKIAWQIVLGIAAALLFLFIIAKFSASVTGNVPAVDAGESFIIESLGEGVKWIELFFGELTVKDGMDEGQVLLIKVMFFSLALIVSWIIVGKVKFFISEGQTAVNPVLRSFLTFVFGVLFTRWIAGNSAVLGVLTSYSAVGMALSALLPLGIIYYFLTYVIGGEGVDDAEVAPIRIFGWLLFFGYLIFQTIITYQAVYNNEEGIFQGGINGNLDIILVYPICMIITLIIIFATPYIRATVLKKTAGKVPQSWFAERLAEFNLRIKSLDDAKKAGMDAGIADGAIKQIEKTKNEFIAKYAHKVK